MPSGQCPSAGTHACHVSSRPCSASPLAPCTGLLALTRPMQAGLCLVALQASKFVGSAGLCHCCSTVIDCDAGGTSCNACQVQVCRLGTFCAAHKCLCRRAGIHCRGSCGRACSACTTGHSWSQCICAGTPCSISLSQVSAAALQILVVSVCLDTSPLLDTAVRRAASTNSQGPRCAGFP